MGFWQGIRECLSDSDKQVSTNRVGFFYVITILIIFAGIDIYLTKAVHLMIYTEAFSGATLAFGITRINETITNIKKRNGDTV